MALTDKNSNERREENYMKGVLQLEVLEDYSQVGFLFGRF